MARQEAGTDLTDYTLNRYYVTRSYLTRHNDDLLPSADENLKFEDKTNIANRFQGTTIFASFDCTNIDLLKLGLNKDISHTKVLTGLNPKNYLVITPTNEMPADPELLKILSMSAIYTSDNKETISLYTK